VALRKQCSYVVVVASNSSPVMGEIQQAFTYVPADRILLVLPDDVQQAEEYERFKRGADALLPADLPTVPGAQVVGFDGSCNNQLYQAEEASLTELLKLTQSLEAAIRGLPTYYDAVGSEGLRSPSIDWIKLLAWAQFCILWFPLILHQSDPCKGTYRYKRQVFTVDFCGPNRPLSPDEIAFDKAKKWWDKRRRAGCGPTGGCPRRADLGEDPPRAWTMADTASCIEVVTTSVKSVTDSEARSVCEAVRYISRR
jgi:hypothetical protein